MTYSASDTHFDAVVIGSGFGGSVTAYRLAEAGLSVCVLGRGKAYPPDNRGPRRPFRRSDHRSKGAARTSEGDGHPLTLSGLEEVEDDPGSDLRTGTTTLFTHVLEGRPPV